MSQKKSQSTFFRKNKKALIILLFLIFSLPLTYQLAQKAVELLTGASFKPASLLVATDKPVRNLNKIWRGLAQGHEVTELRLDTAVQYLKRGDAEYIRIDHIYDGYGVVDRQDGRLTYDWSKLDLVVRDILAAGAKPYFSLSYMPPAISKGDILEVPNLWGEWGQVVAATVARYSRDYKGGIDGVIYEVWNEPDLFGGWKTYGDKNYVTMYTVASDAAVGVKGTKNFQLGGPATTGFYPAWADSFYKNLDSHVRIDFFSWHRYSADVEDFTQDVQDAVQLIAPQITRPQKLYISEWGVNPERGSGYDSRWAGAHYLAVVSALEDTNLDMALAFEIQDGVTGETQYHGGWGMLTNSKYGAVAPKPRFKAWEMISKLEGSSLTLAGEGTYVTGLGAVDEAGTVRVLAVNYDPRGRHKEVFPLTLSGVENGIYQITEEFLSGRTVKNDLNVQTGLVEREIALGASDAVLVTLTKK